MPANQFHKNTIPIILAIKEKLDRIDEEKRVIKKLIAEKEKKIASARNMETECDQALKLLEVIGSTSRTKIKTQIESLVSGALVTTFERDDYGFKADFVNRRNQIECDLLATVGDRVEDPLESGGGGRVDTISTALRFVLISLTKHPGPIVLDEPGKWVSPEFRANFLAFIKEYSKKAERQIIMTTQVQDYVDNECSIIRMIQSSGDRCAINWVAK